MPDEPHPFVCRNDLFDECGCFCRLYNRGYKGKIFISYYSYDFHDIRANMSSEKFVGFLANNALSANIYTILFYYIPV